jgi:hypothetical protein
MNSAFMVIVSALLSKVFPAANLILVVGYDLVAMAVGILLSRRCTRRFVLTVLPEPLCNPAYFKLESRHMIPPNSTFYRSCASMWSETELW